MSVEEHQTTHDLEYEGPADGAGRSSWPLLGILGFSGSALCLCCIALMWAASIQGGMAAGPAAAVLFIFAFLLLLVSIWICAVTAFSNGTSRRWGVSGLLILVVAVILFASLLLYNKGG